MLRRLADGMESGPGRPTTEWQTRREWNLAVSRVHQHLIHSHTQGEYMTYDRRARGGNGHGDLE